MAYIPFTNAEIEVGKAIKQELFQKTKDNFADHESRISSLSSGANKTILFNNTFIVGGVPVDNFVNTTKVLYDVKIFELALESFLALGTGVITIDVLRGVSLDTSLAISILTTPLILDFTGGDYQTVFASFSPLLQDFISGEYIFIKVLSLPILCDKFRVSCLGV